MESNKDKKIIRYTREELMEINNRNKFQPPKALMDFKSCFFNFQSTEYFTWSPEKYWKIKQSEKKREICSWRLENIDSRKRWSSQKRMDCLSKKSDEDKRSKNKRVEQIVNITTAVAVKEETYKLIEMKKREIFELAEKAATLSKQLFDLHKSLGSNKNVDNSSLVEDLNTSSMSSGYNSMESSINNKSIHETSSPVVATQPESKKKLKLPSVSINNNQSIPEVQPAGLIEHVRKVYQNALIRSQLNKTSTKAQSKQI